jgi:hypothetical protein
MFDRFGPPLTALSAAYVVAAQLIDKVNSTTEAIAVLLAALGVAIGCVRVLHGGLKFASRVDRLVTLLETMPDVVERVERVERHVGLYVQSAEDHA